VRCGFFPTLHDGPRDWKTSMSNNLEQVSVPLPAELREFVARVAEAEDRSQASVIRRLVADANRARTH
jgi:hypothetical protein